MDANIKNLQDALFVLDSMIREEANLAGELTGAQASQIGFIQSMLLKFPLRNCDVGGFNEQQRRFEKWCYQHPDCEGCIIGEIKKRGDSCELIWAKMKYEAQEGGGHGQE